MKTESQRFLKIPSYVIPTVYHSKLFSELPWASSAQIAFVAVVNPVNFTQLYKMFRRNYLNIVQQADYIVTAIQL